MMLSVVEAVQDFGVEVEYIPDGCTGLCQPVDVGVYKPFKHQILHQWEQWMIAEGLFMEQQVVHHHNSAFAGGCWLPSKTYMSK